MSVVTNIILSFSIGEEEYADNAYVLMKYVNEFLIANHHHPLGACLDGWSKCACVGGEKNLETPVFVGAFNYFDSEDFVGFLKTLPWLEPECVQVFIQKQEEDIFTLINPTE